MRAVIQTKDSKDGAIEGSKRVAKRKVNPLSPPTTVEISGIRVHFPFKPYNVQVDYMKVVMEALLKKENALLESPTGTGKTLCLLCASLAWQRQMARDIRSDLNDVVVVGGKNNNISQDPVGNNSQQEGSTKSVRVPTIIYASRTHSQLSQVVRELRNTRYRPTHAVLGSREQMCVNPKVKKSNATASDINHDCNKLGKERKCRFRNNLEGFSAPQSCNDTCGSANPNETQRVMDMEELVTMGKNMKICPFYYTRGQVEKAELILVPYNYLFDKDARETTLAEIPWDNAVVIFDEAHNLESFASDSASFDLSSTDIAGCVSEVQKALNYMQAMPELATNLKAENLIKLKALFLQLEDYILNLNNNKTAYSGEFMMEIFLKGSGITHANHEIFIEEVRKVNDLIMDLRGSGATRGSPRLEHFVQCLKRVYGYSLESRCLAKAAFYRVHVSPKPTPSANNNSRFSNKEEGRTISYWCFAPSLAMEELANLNVRSILVTSGTLSPLPSYSLELGLRFPHVIENPHIVKEDQLHVRVIGKGVSGKLLTSSFDRRKDGEYYTELGNTLVSLAKVTPAGMLVFFPSYGVMDTCIERWGGPSNSRKNNDEKNKFFAARRKQATSNRYSFPCAPSIFGSTNGTTTPWKRLLAAKAVVVEPKTSVELPDAISEFHKFLSMKDSRGCILMGVCRGKISEGIDFAHEQSRAVVITGLPFPPAMDPKVKMKREYLENARAKNSAKASKDGGFGGSSASFDKLSGHEWYTQQAHRAVNQAIGRVIRNTSDYGAVLLLDSRFSQPHNQAGLSKWIQPHIKNDEGFGTAIRTLATFYRNAEAENIKRAADEERMKANAPAVLQYEEDGIDTSSEKALSKVALIKRPPDIDDRRRKEANCDIENCVINNSTYIPPNAVVARLDVDDLRRSSTSVSSEANFTTASAAPSAPSNNDAVFKSNNTARKSSDNSKEVAMQFMSKVKTKLSASNQSTIRKAIVSMKKSGEEKDLKAYFNSAKQVIDLVLDSEKFESQAASDEKRMLFLFFELLPLAYRKDVELNAFKLVFWKSAMGQIAKENLSNDDTVSIRTKMAYFLQSLWCRKNGPSLQTEDYLKRVRDIFSLFKKAERSVFLKLSSSFCLLIPKQFVHATKLMANEIVASRNIEMMKLADKARVGEDLIDPARFRTYSKTPGLKEEQQQSKTEPQNVAQLTQPKQYSGASTIIQNSKWAQLKRKGIESVTNPYAKKKATNSGQQVALKIEPIKSIPMKTKSMLQTENSSLSSYLKAVETETYVKKNSTDAMKRLQSLAPKNMDCPVCNNLATEPLIAECGHIACLPCWSDWLKRSDSCMICRQKTAKDSLARILYDPRSTSEEAPTLTQLCVNASIDESDEELEITA